jgi:biopolymer transport protein ExbD
MVLIIGCILHAAAKDDCRTNKPILVHVAKDGSIHWGPKSLTYGEALRRFSNAAKDTPMPNIEIVPDRMAKFDSVARVLADIQKTGFHCIGFTGIDSGH